MVYLSLILSLSTLSGCSTLPIENDSVSNNSEIAKAVYLQTPSTDCEIRKWYNYQVVAIPLINKRWLSDKVTLRERAKRAYDIRHKARMNARFMMLDKSEVKKLRERDKAKYGNPNGPTFPYLVKRSQEKGVKGDNVYKKIIQSSSRTSPTYNGLCEKR